MKRYLNRWLILLSISLIGFLATAQAQTKEEKQVAAAVEQLKQAMISGERKALEAIVSDALSYGHSSGKVEDKAAFVEAIVSGTSDFVTMDLTNQTIRVTGKTAIVRHQLTGETNDSGKPSTVKLGVMLVWQKQGSAWKLLARQSFKL
ncbi:nuclear transport factor 2 family protein [Rufibacter latericius]|uniref:Nuclear transport factor 2 family protein n=1 Tax=Rufibacter latericius TaxID=2487040 RepID=A0A3M9N2J2_9BACT|nr:nuclear transport factor 2 family protein [Rufibacter latericius]RNI31373.1 nuclear transport factor 2 family protein [Rufibacter latericius]